MAKVVLNKSVIGEKRFFSNNGAVYSNLKELQVGLQYMDLQTFSHHATLEKNDFAQWVGDLFDAKLAVAMSSSKNPLEMSKHIAKRLR